MLYRFWLVLVIISLLSVHTQAQAPGSSSGRTFSTGNVHVRVVFENSRNAGPNLLVRLMKGSSTTPVESAFTSDMGEANFIMVPIGDYNVEVSGDGIDTVTSPTFEVDERKVAQSQYVTVRRVMDSGPRPLDSKSPLVSAADLSVPSQARKELDRGNEEMILKDYKKAQQHLEKAIAIAPRYVTAYNNLGVLYARMNDLSQEQKALEKAISIDARFLPALFNLGRLELQQRDYSKAEDLLGAAVSLDALDPVKLMFLANAELLNRHYQQAISHADQAHTASPTEHPSLVHYIAARAYQRENKLEEALAEFRVFLQEEPKGPRADHVREDIAHMTAPIQ